MVFAAIAPTLVAELGRDGMRIAQVMGNVTLSQAHPTFARGRLRLVVPLTLEQASTGSQEDLAKKENDEN